KQPLGDLKEDAVEVLDVDAVVVQADRCDFAAHTRAPGPAATLRRYSGATRRAGRTPASSIRCISPEISEMVRTGSAPETGILIVTAPATPPPAADERACIAAVCVRTWPPDDGTNTSDRGVFS